MSEEQYKVLVLVIPAYGHLNPMTSFINELAKNKNLKIFFPGNEVDRKLIESTKAQFVPMHVELFQNTVNMNELRNSVPLDKMMNISINVGRNVLPKMAEFVQKEKIDLVIYDFATSHGKWLKQHLEYLQRSGKFSGNLPGFVMFSPSFMCSRNVYPNKAEPLFFPKPKFSLSIILKILVTMIRYLIFGFKFGLKRENPNNFLFHREELNICCITPEVQPRSHMFEKSLVFVGSCACKFSFCGTQFNLIMAVESLLFQPRNSEAVKC